MKKAIFIILLAALLSGCGNAADTNTETAAPAQTTAVSHNTNISETAPEIKAVNVKISEEKKTTTTTTAETTSTSKTTTTTTNAETTTSGTTSKSTTRRTVSESTTAKRPIQQTETQTYIVYYDEPSPETQQTQPEVRVTETKPITTTTVQTTPPTTTMETTTTTQSSTTTAEPYTEPQKMNVTEHWLIYFSDSHSKDYYVNIGKSLANDGSDFGKAEAVFEYMQSEFSGERNCIYMSSIAHCLCEGIGLDCGYAMMSDWYHHCANAVKVNGAWYVLDTQAGGFLCEDIGYTKVIDEYENILDVRLSECDY